MQPYSQKPQQGMSLQQMPLSTQEPNRNWGDFSSQAAMPQNPAGDDNLHQALERAGAGNFAQQLQQIAQQLQFFLMERLHYAQNQVQTQAQAQLREFQQIQQEIAMAVQQLQQAQMSAGTQPNMRQ